MNSLELDQVLARHPGQGSFHLASGAHARLEVWRLSEGQLFGPFRYGGQLVLQVLEGSFLEPASGHTAGPRSILEYQEAEPAVLKCLSPGALLVLWAPGFAPLERL